MQGQGRAHDHHPAGLTRLLAALGATAFLALSQPALAANDGLRLPTQADAIAFAPRSECLLNGKGGPLPSILVHGCIETRLPGPVSDDERVTVSLGTDGVPVGVRDVQRLVLHGLGDFEFKIPGPALDVRGLPGSQDQPGLRKGAVLWQGFSPGTKQLGAALQLRPELEARRLPLAFDMSITVGGKPLELGERRSGPLRISMTIRNRSPLPVQIPTGAGDPSTLGTALDAIHAVLAGGGRPVPGQDGVPGAIPGARSSAMTSVEIEAPFAIRGSVSFPAGSVTGLRATGGEARSTTVRFASVLGGGAPLSRTITITGTARNLALPSMQVAARPSPPQAREVSPPNGRSWTEAAASGAVDSERMLRLAFTAMWQTALLAPFDRYLGNPDPTGPSTTSYRFVLSPREEQAAAPVASVTGVRALGVVWFALAALALLFGLAFAWARA